MKSSMLTPWPEQLEDSDKGEKIIRDNMLVYLAMEERTGKSLTAILIAEELNTPKVLIVTKKGKPAEGWEDTVNNYIHINSYTVINYHSVHKVKGDFDLVILDEAHNYISSYPKRSKIWNEVAKKCKDKPIIYCSATPFPQGTQQLFNQLALSSWSPWYTYNNYYDWFKKYAELDDRGNFPVQYIGNNRTAICYDKVKHNLIRQEVDHLFVTRTRAECGFEHEPEDVIHYIDLSEKTKAVYNHLLKTKVLEFTHAETGIDYSLMCDSGIKLRWALHMLEGGVLKLSDIVNNKEVVTYLDLGNTEKVDYILNNWGDTEDLVIMYQYKADKVKLEKYFKKAKILQAQTYSEGVDLSMHKHLVIYSQDFSTGKHTQRRARQANKKRKDPILVHFLLVKKAVSEQVYKTVSINKKNFVDSLFDKEEL